MCVCVTLTLSVVVHVYFDSFQAISFYNLKVGYIFQLFDLISHTFIIQIVWVNFNYISPTCPTIYHCLHGTSLTSLSIKLLWGFYDTRCSCTVMRFLRYTLLLHESSCPMFNTLARMGTESLPFIVSVAPPLLLLFMRSAVLDCAQQLLRCACSARQFIWNTAH